MRKGQIGSTFEKKRHRIFKKREKIGGWNCEDCRTMTGGETEERREGKVLRKNAKGGGWTFCKKKVKKGKRG